MTRTLLPLMLIACSPDPLLPTDPGVVPQTFESAPSILASEVIPTVFEVRFETTSTSTSWVEVTDTAGTWQTPAQAGQTNHAHALLGLKAGQEITWRVAVEDADGVVHHTDPESLSVPPPPPGMPDFLVTAYEPTLTTAERFFSLTYLVGGGAGSFAVIVDQDGDPVWWASQVDESAVAMVKPSLDGQALMVAHLRDAEGAELGVYRVPLDAMTADDVTLTPTVDAHHDFVELADGTIAHIGDRYPMMPYGGESDVMVKVDQIVEVSPDGERKVVFDVLDDLPAGAVEPSCSHNEPTFEQGVLGAGWGHANSLVYDATDDTYIMNLRNLDMMVKVDRQGELLWTLGGRMSNFTFPKGMPFDHGHFSDWRGTEFGMFSNGLHEGVARAVWYQGFPARGTIEPVWSYDHPQGRRIDVLGDVDKLPGGNMFVAWGPDSAIEEIAIDEITRESDVVWRVEAFPETILARADWFDDLYDLTGAD